ncbi:MAG TPA: hypothetical protein VFK15_00365 [Burkholderiales bacterium]|jgi:hypothetical protein|nr:hypothetical protein [Burkholderiales bacterium]
MDRIPVYDPRGVVEATPVALASRVKVIDGLRLALLDNTKWNANKLLRGVRERLAERHRFAAINYYRKESFSLNARPELIDEIAANNDVVVTAIGD